MRRYLWPAGILLSLSLAGVASGQNGGGEGINEGADAYRGALMEKVGEVAEIKYKALADSRFSGQDGEKALLRLAQYRFFLEDYTGTEYYLRRLTTRDDLSGIEGEARLWMGRTYLARGEWRAAQVEFLGGLETLEAGNVSDPELIGRYLFWVGETYRQSGKALEAREYYENLSARFPAHSLSAIVSRRLRSVNRDLGVAPGSEPAEEAPVSISPPGQTPPPEVAPTDLNFRVQVASFSSRANAAKLVEDLTSVGYAPRIREVHLESGARFRVYLDGYDSREEAERVARELERKGYGKAFVEEQE